MKTEFNDILTTIADLKLNKGLVEWDGVERNHIENWMMILTNRPQILLGNLKTSIKAAFPLNGFDHAKEIAQQIADHFGMENSFQQRKDVSESNLHLVVQVVYTHK